MANPVKHTILFHKYMANNQWHIEPDKLERLQKKQINIPPIILQNEFGMLMKSLYTSVSPSFWAQADSQLRICFFIAFRHTLLVDHMFDAFQQQTSLQEADSRSSIQQEAEKWMRRSPQHGLIAAGITPEHVSEPDTILHLWRKSELESTGLARWARLVFSIPATSAAVERMWHRAKLMVTPLRHALHPDLVRDEIFVAINEKQLLW